MSGHFDNTKNVAAYQGKSWSGNLLVTPNSSVIESSGYGD